MAALLIGYVRCSTDQQDLTAQRDGLAALGVDINRVYVDHGLTGTNRERPGLREALAACREGDTLVVTKLDRLARSLPDARAIADELTVRQVRLNLGGSVYDPTDPVGRLLFNVLAMVAESDLIWLRTREGMKVAKAKGRLRGKQPKLNHRQEAHLVALLNGGEYSTAELAALFGVARSTVYRAVERERARNVIGVGTSVGLKVSLRCPAGTPLRDSNALLVVKTFGHRSTFGFRCRARSPGRRVLLVAERAGLPSRRALRTPSAIARVGDSYRQRSTRSTATASC
jgi:DNA invertase Pin-like site-specific DNA recombinase